MATALTTGGGFGGFAPLPLAARKSGTVIKKRVGEPGDDLGMEPLPTTVSTATPRPTASPPRTTQPPFRPDPSGAGLVPSSLGGNTLRSLPNERWSPSPGGGGGGVTVETPTWKNQGRTRMTDIWADDSTQPPMITSGGGKPPPFTSDPNADWIGTDETGGEWAQNEGPSTGTGGTRDDGLPTEPGMEGEPDLIAQQPSPSPTPSNEWTTSPGDRRFLPSPSTDPRYMANFGGNMTLGQFLSTPLAFLRFGENRGGTQPPVSGGDISYAGTTVHTPGTPGYEPASELTPAELQGERDTADAKARGDLNPDGTTPGEPGGQHTRFSSDPRSRFGNLNSPTGQAVYMDAQGNWRPVSGAPSNIRWDPLSGTGNAIASATTEAYLAGGQQPGNPNSTATFATEGRFMTDEEGAPTMQGPTYGDRSNEFRGTQGGPTPYGNAASQLAFFNWQRQQPEYQAWLKKRGG